MTVCEPRLRNRPLSVTRDRRGGARSSRHSFARALHTWSTILVPVDPSRHSARASNLSVTCRWLGVKQAVGHTLRGGEDISFVTPLRVAFCRLGHAHGPRRRLRTSYILEP